MDKSDGKRVNSQKKKKDDNSLKRKSSGTLEHDKDNENKTPSSSSITSSYQKLISILEGPTYWSFVASLSFLCTGLLRAYTSPALLSIQSDPDKDNILSLSPLSAVSSSLLFSSRKDAISWIASIAPLASFVGTILSGPLLEQWGRKRTLLLLSVTSTIGWIFVANSWSISVLLLGRSLTGLASGFATATAPLYISEVVQVKKCTGGGAAGNRRGLLPGVMLSTGILLGFVLAHQIQVWRRLALIIALFPGALALLSLTIPESPVWLSSRKQTGKLQEIQFDLEMEQVVPSPTKNKSSSSSEKTGLIPKENSSFNLPIYLRVGFLMLFQQWSGGNVLIYYLSEILTINVINPSDSEESSPPGTHPEPEFVHQASLIIALVQFIGFFLTLPLIDHPRVGRRFLLMSSALLMMLAHLFLGFHFHHLIITMKKISPIPHINTETENTTPYYPADLQTNYINHQNNNDNFSSSSSYDFVIRVTSLAALLSCYSIGLGPIPFLFIENHNSNTATGEVVNDRSLTKSSYLSSFASLVNHLALFLAVKCFPYLFHMEQQQAHQQLTTQSTLQYFHGPDVTFWLFAGVCWITALFTFYSLPSSDRSQCS